MPKHILRQAPSPRHTCMLLRFQARADKSSNETHEHGHRRKQDTGNLDDTNPCSVAVWHVYGYSRCVRFRYSESNQSRLGKQKSDFLADSHLRHAAVGFFDVAQPRKSNRYESSLGCSKRRICNYRRPVFLPRKGESHKDVGRWPFPDFRFSIILEWPRNRLTSLNSYKNEIGNVWNE
jgi:hypothetical protein